ncbi:spermidine/putrescine ABC transporter ATP-binding protein [Candidatus Endobugula sertula]|uniref:Spermidine/putrescine import ATP-binding protein PotA n=1 Tax=Candidatus Endobugula sertula TaxID=62101 RepID=A0A1D2QM80_9GAMM|nr:spermidine/putrescine ABC transporter ATP-binding protein [Candidatus Endobugula sertula]
MRVNGDSAILINGLRKVYESTENGVVALKRADLEVLCGEFFTLLGPSGCGKTTLLRLIAGFEYPTEGEIHLFGKNIANLPPFKRPVNTVFQNYALFPHLTVAENVAFGLQGLKKAKSEVAEIVTEMLEMVHLGHLADRHPDKLSGGQRQRIALARALAPRPEVLLLDEPLSALDLKLRQAMREELKRIQEQTGITFIFVTHDQEEALAMSDRIAVMSEGQIQQIGTPEEIYESPSNQFVANFIGETNLVNIEVVGVNNGTVECSVAEGLILKCTNNHNVVSGDKRTLSIRPENIRFVDPSTSGALPCKLIEKTYIGTDIQYQVALADGVELRLREQNTWRDGKDRCSHALGDELAIDVPVGATQILAD